MSVLTLSAPTDCCTTGLTSTINGLKTRGFHSCFTLIDDWLLCSNPCLMIRRTHLIIREMHYFPPGSLSSRELMIYALQLSDYSLKGILLLYGADKNILFLVPASC